jgi:hypothetical protein
LKGEEKTDGASTIRFHQGANRWKGGLPQLGKNGYRHEVTILRGQGKDAAIELLPRVHRVAGLLKRWLPGTHQGSVSGNHKQG